MYIACIAPGCSNVYHVHRALCEQGKSDHAVPGRHKACVLSMQALLRKISLHVRNRPSKLSMMTCTVWTTMHRITASIPDSAEHRRWYG